MNTKPNDLAFAALCDDAQIKGLTKREYFAAAALTGLQSNLNLTTHDKVKRAVSSADQLIGMLNEGES